MTLEQRERFKQAEAAEKLKQQEVRARHDTDRIYNTDPYEETPAEETVDKLANKPSLGIMSVLIRVVLFILIACAFVAFRSGKPGRVATVAGLHVPLNLKVHGDYQHLLGAGRDSPGVVAVYLHHDMNSASDWSGLAPFADDAPNAVPCGTSKHTTRLGSATAHRPTSEDCAPGRWAAPRSRGVPGPRRREAKEWPSGRATRLHQSGSWVRRPLHHLNPNLNPNPNPNQADAPFFLHLATAKISKTLLFVCDGDTPSAALRDAATRGGASAALAAALDETLAAAAPTPRAAARLFITCHEGATLLLYQPEPGPDGKVAYLPKGGATVDEGVVCDALLQALLGPQAEERDQTAALELRESVAGGFGKQAAFSTKKRYPVHSEL